MVHGSPTTSSCDAGTGVALAGDDGQQVLWPRRRHLRAGGSVGAERDLQADLAHDVQRQCVKDAVARGADGKERIPRPPCSLVGRLRSDGPLGRRHIQLGRSHTTSPAARRSGGRRCSRRLAPFSNKQRARPLAPRRELDQAVSGRDDFTPAESAPICLSTGCQIALGAGHPSEIRSQRRLPVHRLVMAHRTSKLHRQEGEPGVRQWHK